jgi:hypothetical protein
VPPVIHARSSMADGSTCRHVVRNADSAEV